MINQLYQIQKRKRNICISYPKYFEINVFIIFIVTNSIDVNLNEKRSTTSKKNLFVLSIILIGLIILTIFYFLNPQIKYIYQHDRSIGIDYNKVFATLSTPIDIATDNEGNVYVLDSENNKVQKFTTNGTFVKEWNIQRTKASELVPTDIATDNAGNVYVLDGGSNGVQKYTIDGIFVKEWNIN